MKPSLRSFLVSALALFASAAWAEFHTYKIEEIFSNSSGSVQYIVMHESAGADKEYFWARNKITSTVPMSYTFPNDLPVTSDPPPMCNPYYGCMAAVMPAVLSTADTRVLIATAGFAALGIVTPDFVVPNGFVPVGGGTINYAGVDQVTFGPLPTDGVTAIDRTGAKRANLATNFAGQSASVTAVAGLDLNQHGLTGSWYKAATDGQGVEVEVFPDLRGAGTGFVFVSWFTYDTSVGGADHQRWYTASGNVVSGQPSASLTIFQDTGGNFVAPPSITNPPSVGTATLAFDTCSSGTLTYNFADGRAGAIALTRVTQNVTCSTTNARPTNADFALSGNWYDAATSGQGLTVEVNPNNRALFLTWYTYAPNGAAAGAAGQRWYTALQTAFVPGSRSIDVQIRENTGGLFDAATNPPPPPVVVGTGTIAFQSCSLATFKYNFTGGTSSGQSGTINLTRLVPQQVTPGCA